MPVTIVTRFVVVDYSETYDYETKIRPKLSLRMGGGPIVFVLVNKSQR